MRHNRPRDRTLGQHRAPLHRGPRPCLGSGRNVGLTQLARTSKAMLVEGDDFATIHQIARVLHLPGLGSGLEIAATPLQGFPTIERFRAMRRHSRGLGSDAYIAACFDRDYRCDEEVDSLTAEFGKHANSVAILVRHEIESYLLSAETVSSSLDDAKGPSARNGIATYSAASPPMPSSQPSECRLMNATYRVRCDPA